MKINSITLEEVLSSGKILNEEEIMDNYCNCLWTLLQQVADPKNMDKVTLVDGIMPAFPVGKVVDTLKRLFPSDWKNQQKYNRSYRYLKQLSDQGVLENWGWEILVVDGHKHIVLSDPEKFVSSQNVNGVETNHETVIERHEEPQKEQLDHNDLTKKISELEANICLIKKVIEIMNSNLIKLYSFIEAELAKTNKKWWRRFCKYMSNKQE